MNKISRYHEDGCLYEVKIDPRIGIDPKSDEGQERYYLIHKFDNFDGIFEFDEEATSSFPAHSAYEAFRSYCLQQSWDERYPELIGWM